MDRRSFLQAAVAAPVAAQLGDSPLVTASIPRAVSASILRKIHAARDRIKVTRIERHELYLPFHPFNAQDIFRYHGYRIRATTVLALHTNVGLVGAGESWGIYDVTDEQRKKYIGSSPFDWIGSRVDLPFNMAMYDLMGQYLDIPVWKLIGEKIRDRIPVAAWTVSQTPEKMAAEVQHAARLGYTWIKYHVDEVQNVVEQTKAMQAVAPPGFRVHYDFNMNSRIEFIEPVLHALKRFPIVGRIEDPINSDDPAAWRRLKETFDWPIVAHHAPIDFVVNGCADGSMAGHAPIGHAIRMAGVSEQLNAPLMLQQCGTYINQAFLAHEAAVFPAATMDHVNLAEMWTDRVVGERMPIDKGSIRVPDGPGLGVAVDRDRLRELAEVQRPAYKPFLVRIVYKNGPTIVARHNPNIDGRTDNMRLLARLLGKNIPGPRPGYMNDVRTDWWDDVDDPDYQRAWRATESRPFIVL